MTAYVTAILRGGFANRVFIIHAALTYAKKSNKQFVLVRNYILYNTHEPEDVTMGSLEKLFHKFTYYENSTKDWRKINDPDQNAFIYQAIPNYPEQSIILDGYFQSPLYLPEKPPTLKTEKKPNTYFLHIRLGDYTTSPFYQIPLQRYYSKAIMNIMEHDINAKFLVFCNENDKIEQYIKTNIKVPFDYTVSSAATAYDTLSEMSACTGAICTNSSLSWMGAYYQDPKTEIYMPRPWTTIKKVTEIYPLWATIIDCSVL
jgi:hypothetical protein